MTEENAASRSTRTGLAIVTAIAAAVLFYFLYSILLCSAASLFAGDDTPFDEIVGALLVFGSNFLACMSGAAVTKRLFPRANLKRVFYAFATILLIGGVAIALDESADPNGSAIAVGIDILTVAVTIFGLWIYLRPRAVAGLANQ
jgi:hypothetical protein